MSEAATKASSSSEDDGNDGCNRQGICDRGGRFSCADTFCYKL